MSQLKNIVVNALVGTQFGCVLEKAGVVKPDVITSQMGFTGDWTMMKMFLAGTGSSAVILALLDIASAAFGIDGIVTLRPRPLRLGPNIVGGALVGAGMAWSASCPGTVFAQVGSGYESTGMYTLLGGVLSSALMSAIHPYIKGWLTAGSGVVTVHGALGLPYYAVALPFGVACIGAAFLVDKLFRGPIRVSAAPEGQQAVATSDCAACRIASIAKQPSWSPIYSGLFLGAIQAQLNTLTCATLGASSAFAAVYAWIVNVFAGDFVKGNSFLSGYVSDSKSITQVMSNLGIILGARLSSWTSGTLRTRQKAHANPGTKKILMALFSGFIMLLGARIADGCTSGHGLSGMAQLSMSGFVTVAAMFAGGFAATKIRAAF